MCSHPHDVIFGLWKLVIGNIMIGFLVVHNILVFESFQILKKGMGLGIQMSKYRLGGCGVKERYQLTPRISVKWNWNMLFNCPIQCRFVNSSKKTIYQKENIYVNCVKIRIIQVACSWRKGWEDKMNQIWYVLKFDPSLSSSFKNENYGCSQNFIE